jgi:hypothetical protein
MKYHAAKRIKGNKYRVENESVYILLQDGQECIVDTDEFYNKDLAHFTWTLDHKDLKQAYVRTTKTLPDGTKRPVLIQYKIMGTELEARKDYVIDHINGNHLDNRKFNLRFASVKQNNSNRH